MRAQLTLRCAVLAVTLLAVGAACGGPPPVSPDQTPSGSPAVTVPTDPWGQLAARTAAAQDKRYVASYKYTVKGRAASTVTVTVALDGSWLVSIPGGALSGTTDVAVADSAAGLYQCVTSGTTPGCVRVSGPAGRLPFRADPRVQHVFTDWPAVLTNRQVAISVDTATPIAGTTGKCFSVEPNSASLAAPVDAGTYCYAADGTLTAAALTMGTLILTGSPGAAPPTATLPAPVVPGEPLPTGGVPPSPSPSGPVAS